MERQRKEEDARTRKVNRKKNVEEKMRLDQKKREGSGKIAYERSVNGHIENEPPSHGHCSRSRSPRTHHGQRRSTVEGLTQAVSPEESRVAALFTPLQLERIKILL